MIKMCRENYDSLKANFLIFVLHFQPPCCSPDQGSCGLSEVCKDCTTVIYSYDLIELITIVCAIYLLLSATSVMMTC